MERIRLELADWLYNAGIVGIANILRQNNYEIGKNYIEFDVEQLENFEEKYFGYFVEKYEKFSDYSDIISDINFLLDIKIFNEEINKKIERIKKYEKRAVFYEFEFIKNKLKSLNKIKKIEDLSKNELKDFLIFLEFHKHYILVKLLTGYFDQKVGYSKSPKAILDKFYNTGNIYIKTSLDTTVKEKYKNYFLESVVNYKEAMESKINCFVCDRKIKNQNESFGLSWINSIGVATNSHPKTSHFWNFNVDANICPICNLVYSCIPAGFTFLNRKGIFINDNSNAENLIKINSIALSEKGGAQLTIEDLENQSYFKIVDTMEQAKINKTGRELENIQVVKLDSNNIQRPYTFNVLDKNLLEIIKTHEKDLKFLLNSKIKITDKDWLNLYPEVLKRLYNNKNQFDLVYQMFSLLFQKKHRNFSAIETILKINNNFLNGNKKEEVFMSDEKKEIEVEKIRNYGYWVRKDFEQKNEDKKLEGISYRLLNTLRTKNQMGFMDNLIQVYWGKEIPSIFTKALADVNDFQTIGYAFLLGLQGKKENKERNDNENSNITEEKTNE